MTCPQQQGGIGCVSAILRFFKIFVIVPDEYVLRGAVPQSIYLDDIGDLVIDRYYYVNFSFNVFALRWLEKP